MLNILKNRLITGHKRSVVLKKNIAVSLLIKGCSLLVSFIVVSLTLGYVSKELYGLWITLSSVVIWFQFADMGVANGLKNRLAEAVALKNYDHGKMLVSSAYGMMIFLLIPLFIIFMIIIPYINWCAFLTVNAIYDYEIRQTLYILTSLFFAQILLNTLSAVLSAFQETAVVSVLGLLGQIFVLLILLGVRYFKDPSLAVLCFSFMGAPVLVMCGATIYLYHGRLCTVAPSIRYFNKNCIYSLCDMGLKFFLIQLQVIVLFQSTNIIIAHLANQEVVAQYNIAYKYIGAAEMLLVIFITPLWPAFTEAFARKDFNWMRSVYKKFSILYLYFLLLIILMIVFSPIVYHVWLGNKIEIPVSMTIFIGIYMVVRCWDSIQVYMLNGIGDIKMQMYVTLIGLIAHIPLSFIIGKYMGALGVTCSMTIIVAIYSLVFTVKLRKIIFHAVQKTTAV